MRTAKQLVGVCRSVVRVAGMPRSPYSAGPAIVVGRCTVRGMAQYSPVRVVPPECGGVVRVCDVCSE